MSQKTYKQTPEKRKYFRERARKTRLTKHVCEDCGKIAYAKILLTQQYKCALHMVTPLKTELQQQKETQS